MLNKYKLSTTKINFVIQQLPISICGQPLLFYPTLLGKPKLINTNICITRTADNQFWILVWIFCVLYCFKYVIYTRKVKHPFYSETNSYTIGNKVPLNDV
ncbi:unnamed protein product [Meganyctiphanes norvegica]|uniref:Uncharacterized protein n=1 Tax=Meganyctiphanes norvegica TaxID=48144 RepID=A0AAV2RT36_MEGNR